MKIFIFAFLFVLAPLAGAAVDDEPPIKGGTAIQVRAWDPRSQTYDIVMPQFEAQGPNYATLADLAKAVTSLDLKRVKANPKTIVGMEYVLDKELRLQSVLKVQAAQKKKSPKR
ncbi:MAG: hypothetical protein KF799_14460 [Bdellovibrionales bacterium]|nr:hypothetical protein [Bdellovibrionales bacterium]